MKFMDLIMLLIALCLTLLSLHCRSAVTPLGHETFNTNRIERSLQPVKNYGQVVFAGRLLR